MASIESLLNPMPDLVSFTSHPVKYRSKALPTPHPHAKRPKVAKDAPIFNRGKIRGELRYPPCEQRDKKLTEVHHEFQIRPMSNIADFPRHIPYNSEKKSFQEKTGRESFEVFQYTFVIPGEEKEWTVMWDYNIGLVRTTHLFKCLDYSKTTPAKMLNSNPGLRDVCHSITGGALAAQGYWMPFEAAKAVAATFCWKIRYALTPIFGVDFPLICIHPQDRTRFGRMIIDSAVVKRATATAKYFRSLEIRPIHGDSGVGSGYGGSSPPRDEEEENEFRANKHVLLPGSHQHQGKARGFDVAREYNDAYCVSPTSPYRNSFTPVNMPRSLDTGSGVGSSASSSTVPSPWQILARVSSISPKGESEDDEDDSSETDSTRYSELSGTPTDCLSSMDVDEDCPREKEDDESNRKEGEKASSESARSSDRTRKKEATSSMLFAKEVKAAHALLSLHMQDAVAEDQDHHGHASSNGQRWSKRGLERKRRRVSV